MSQPKLLNIGCGATYHRDWTNIDLYSNDPAVIQHDISRGLPFEDGRFDAVYHSHVLEHLEKSRAPIFLRECSRVLKSGGVIRLAVPDLEQIVRNYLANLELALKGDKGAAANYDWMMLELYDQTVRNCSGGEMAKFLRADKIENEEFVFGRIGDEGRRIRQQFLSGKQNATPAKETTQKPVQTRIADKIKRTVSGTRDDEFVEIGKFRKGGEIHQWMYDRFSLGRLLAEIGFVDVRAMTAMTSSIPNWNSFELDSNDGVVRKPDSLFMEGKKP